MIQMTWCECSNFNCDWGEGMAEPYSQCVGCGCSVFPVDEMYDLSREEFGEGDDDQDVQEY